MSWDSFIHILVNSLLLYFLAVTSFDLRISLIFLPLASVYLVITHTPRFFLLLSTK